MTEPTPELRELRLARLMDHVQRQGAARIRALVDADAAFTEAFDAVQAALEAGDRVNLTRVAQLLDVDRGTVYNELRRRGVKRPA